MGSYVLKRLSTWLFLEREDTRRRRLRRQINETIHRTLLPLCVVASYLTLLDDEAVVPTRQRELGWEQQLVRAKSLSTETIAVVHAT